MSPDATVLAGSWSLLDVLPGTPLSGPEATYGIAITIKVAGKQLSATYATQFICGAGSVDVYYIPMTGVVSDNGTFTMTVPVSSEPPGYPIVYPALEVSGTLPDTPGGQWQGTFNYVLDPKVCPQSFKGSFTATQIQPLIGTFSGTAAIEGIPTPVTIAANLTQGETISASGTLPSFFDPLSVTGGITISGISCFSSGTLSNVKSSPYSSLIGNFVELSYVMDDGSNLLVFGHETDLNAKAIEIDALWEASGNCQFSQLSQDLTLSK